MHYQRLTKYGDPLYERVYVTREKTVCSIDGCGVIVGPRSARGLCRRHYRSWLSKNTERREVTETCTIKGCTRPHKAKGFCGMHHERWYKYGSPLADAPARPKTNGRGFVTGSGYRIVYAPDHANVNGHGQMAEHRLLMSQSLGRPLLPNENVHHKNGNKLDNRLVKGHELKCHGDCCNLELWSKSQPAGQRVEDKIAWAKALLAQYADYTGGRGTV